MRIPGPGDLLRVAGDGYQALERTIAMVPRLAAVLTEVESIVRRVGIVVAEVEQTQHRATLAVDHIEAIESRVDAVIDRTETVVDRAATLTARAEPLLDAFQPTLQKLEPLLARIAETTSPDEVDAVVKLIDALPSIADKLDADILPVLDTLATVAPDLRDLLDVSKQLNELIGSVPGLGRVKRKIEEEQDAQDGYRAEEEPKAAPERRG